MICGKGEIAVGNFLRISRGGRLFHENNSSFRSFLARSQSTASAVPAPRTIVSATLSRSIVYPDMWNKTEGSRTWWHHGMALAAATAACTYLTTRDPNALKNEVSLSDSRTTAVSGQEQTKDLTGLLSLLEAAVGKDNFSVDAAQCEAHSTTEYSLHRSSRCPDVVVTPSTTEEVAAIVKACAKHNMSIIPYGGATSLEGQLLAPSGGCCLDFSHMNKILRLSEADHDVTVQPGIGYVELNEILKERGLWFPLDPGPGASLGGMCACSCSGSTAVRYGTMKENVLSLTVVLANGEVVKTKSRAKKSSAGYDLTHIFVGSEGTLGVITEITIKLHKIPEYSTAVRVSFESIDAAAKTVQDVLAAGIQIGRAELMDDTMMSVLNSSNGTKHREATTVLFELAGESAAGVEDATSAVLALVKERGGGVPHLATEAEERRELWRERKEALWSLMGLYPELTPMVTDVCVPVSRLAELISESKKELDASPLPAPLVAHAGDGNFHVLIMFDDHDPSAVAEANRLSSFMVYKALEMDGTCTGEHGVGLGKIKYLLDEHGPGAVHTMRKIKRALDPQGIMNPGKVLEHQRDPKTGRLILCS